MGEQAGMAIEAEIAVVGDGLAGLTAAVAFALQGRETICFGHPDDRRTAIAGRQPGDRRTTALFQASVRFLDHLGVWQKLADGAAPLRALRMIDDTARLWRAPEILFEAGELGFDAFGYNVTNQVLGEALRERAREVENLRLIATTGIERVQGEDAGAWLLSREGERFGARLVIGADGRNSICRRSAGLSARSWDYGQTAIACNFEHSRPHDDTSNEFHREPGPLTTVPLSGNRSSLVWSERPAEAERLMALDDVTFAATLGERLHGILGGIGEVTPRAAFPIRGQYLTRLTGRRIALVGEAGHVLPPIGAQGLNLGLRDIAALFDAVADASGPGGDPGARTVLADYDRARRLDVASRTFAVDILNRALISGLAPASALRSAGLTALSISGPLRRFMMREGMQPSIGLPRLMRAG